jgi:hypothetical protein
MTIRSNQYHYIVLQKLSVYNDKVSTALPAINYISTGHMYPQLSTAQ